jgi:HSP20 family molecular chaperone IbpA
VADDRTHELLDVDSALTQVEALFRSVTGREVPPPPDVPLAPIPVDQDPTAYVSERANRLLEMLDNLTAMGLRPPEQPPMTMQQSSEELVIAIDLKGVPSDAVRLLLTNDTLEVTGDRPSGIAEPGLSTRWATVTGGPFARVVALPPNAVGDEARATFRDGVLEVRVPLTSAITPDA